MKDHQTISREDVMSLLGRASSDGVLSVYLGLPSSGRHDPAHWLSSARSGLRELMLRNPGDKRLAELVEVAQGEVEKLPPETRRRSLIYFRSLEPNWVFWRSLQPYIPDLFAFGPSPQVARLVTLLDEMPRVGIAAVSQDRIRLLTWADGAAADEEELRPDQEEVAPTAEGLSKSAFPPNRAEDRVRRGLARAGQKIGRAGEAHGWTRILLVGTSIAATAVEESLPDAWKRLLIPCVERNMINAPAGEIGEVAGKAIHDWKRQEELQEVERVLEDARSGGRAAAGLEICLARLHQRNVERLFVNSDLEAPGFSGDDGRLYASAPVLAPGSSLRPEPRLIERMVSHALEIGAAVVPLEGEAARRLGIMGGVAARLRWREPAAEREPS